jgi:hypothetical protein
MANAWTLPALGVGLVATQIPVSRAVFCNLSLLHIAVEKLKPKYLSGSGTVPLQRAPSAMEGLKRALSDLHFAVRSHSLREESATKPGHGQEA